MPAFTIRVVNNDFEAANELEAADADEAWQIGMRSALDIGTDEICKRVEPFFGAEVRVEQAGEVKHRFVVAIGQTPLKAS